MTTAKAFDFWRENSDTAIGRPDACWYAAYTRANHEKGVARQFEGRSVEYFLPLYETVHRWKDRRVRLELPLFASYIFVRLPLRERQRVLQVPGVVSLVGFGEHPAALQNEEIELLRNGLRRESNVRPHPYLSAGSKVRIMRGPLAGFEGILIREKTNFRLVMSIDLIMRSIAVDVDAADVRPLNLGKRPGSEDEVECQTARMAGR